METATSRHSPSASAHPKPTTPPVTVFAACCIRRWSVDFGSEDIQWKRFWHNEFQQNTDYDGSVNGVFTNVGYINDHTYPTASVYFPSQQYAVTNDTLKQSTLFAISLP
jgi:hypothetical protein